MEENQIYVHREPIWRDKADYIIMYEQEVDGEAVREQLWARRLDASLVELCCIPFFIYDLALADVVEIDSNNRFIRVAKPSGRWAFRAWLLEATWDSQPELVSQIEALGCLIESSSPRLIAIDASAERVATDVARLLERHELEGLLVYETGKR